jgi:NAD(P)-dependent dehydrogenase (short-subunit alcohol dehydrogenase family)
MELRGKVIAVTGRFGALGLAVANAAMNQGAYVALIDRAAGPVPTEFASRRSSWYCLDFPKTSFLKPACSGLRR